MAFNAGRFELVGGTAGEPNYIYYNCDIINNRTDDINQALLASPDPQIRFNETRDTALVKDVSQYEFSIIRFTVNGANRDLPLFIPNIETGQTDVNLTTYSVALSFQQTYNVAEGIRNLNIAPPPTRIIYEPETKNAILAPTPRPPTVEQDLSTRYYWVYTYQHFLDLVNKTLYTAHKTLYDNIVAAWAALGTATPLPAQFATYTAFQAYVQPPQIVYDDETKPLFTIYADSDAFGQRLEPFVAAVPPAVGATTQPRCRLFFNTNMYGLFANFSNLFWNSIDIGATTIPAFLGGTYPSVYTLPGFPNSPTLSGGNPAYTYPLGYVPEGYVNELIFPNKFFQNVDDYRLAPYSGVPPLGYVPLSAQKAYWKLTQDYKSVDSLWSPISSIVFTTSLIPVKTEAASQPNILGTGNLGDSAPTSKSAFEPIITDIALDLATGGADDYRQFVFYSPSAEYRMSSLTPSKQELRNIDIQVYWKNRLNNQLYPFNMFNLSSVSLKMMFRHKRLSAAGKE